VAFSPDGSRLVSSSEDGKVKVWQIRGGKTDTFIYPGIANAVSFHPDNRRMGYGGEAGFAEAREFTDGRFLMRIPKESDKPDRFPWILSMACSPDGKLLVIAGTDGFARIWEPGKNPNEMTRDLKGHSGAIGQAVFSPDSQRVATAGLGDHTVIMWDAATVKRLYTVKCGDEEPASIAFSPDGKVAVGLGSSRIKVLDAATGRELQTLTCHAGPVLGLDYSRDGRFLASSSWDGTVRLWDTASFAEIRTFKGHTNRVHKVLFSPDGNRLFSCSTDRTIRIWDVSSGQEALALAGHKARILSIALTTDGHYLASASADGTVRLWDGSP
jgi:WD40 repeat protein